MLILTTPTLLSNMEGTVHLQKVQKDPEDQNHHPFQGHPKGKKAFSDRKSELDLKLIKNRMQTSENKRTTHSRASGSHDSSFTRLSSVTLRENTAQRLWGTCVSH